MAEKAKTEEAEDRKKHLWKRLAEFEAKAQSEQTGRCYSSESAV